MPWVFRLLFKMVFSFKIFITLSQRVGFFYPQRGLLQNSRMTWDTTSDIWLQSWPEITCLWLRPTRTFSSETQVPRSPNGFQLPRSTLQIIDLLTCQELSFNNTYNKKRFSPVPYRNNHIKRLITSLTILNLLLPLSALPLPTFAY